ncbi:MAG TPA: bifunctional riboflavin kinase/FAD synthetase [Syntrophomonadaceae bacterium]|nr:bifunctional riboflavin kinase/FAD synthetase [Syntrophomonadaceae bacterium]
MEVLRSLEQKTDGSTLIIALGNFDGVHLGHRKLLKKMVSYAKKIGGIPSVLLFQPHPQQVLDPANAPKLIMSNERKIKVMNDLGVELFYLIPFDLDFASQEPEEFVEEVLIKKLNVNGVFVGYNYQFGKFGAGKPEYLKKIAGEKGIYVEVIPPVVMHGVPISSTLIRSALKNGDIVRAKELLGYWPVLQGEVIKGDQRGRRIGFPTANLAVPEDILIPRSGVYAGEAVVDGEPYLAVLNIGRHPTFGLSCQQTIEAHLLNFHGDLYGKQLEIRLYKMLREEKKYNNADELIVQINKDIELAERICEEIGQKQFQRESSGLIRKIYN